MKYVIYFSLIMCLFSCRSNRSTLESSRRLETTTTYKQKTQENVEHTKTTSHATRTETNTQTDEHIRTTEYNVDGTISKVQEIRRTTGRNELADSTRSGSDVSGINSSTETESESASIAESDEHQESQGDNRPVQGWKEWGIVALVIGVVVIVLILIAISYVKKYRNKLT